MVARGFLRQEDRSRLVSAGDIRSLLTAMEAWRAPEALKFTLAKRMV